MASKVQLIIAGLICSVSLGCSKSNNQLTGNVFTLVTDCAAPQGQDLTVYAVNGLINSGTSYGFPQSAVQIGQESTGPVAGGGGGTRTCIVTYGKNVDDPDEFIYSCADNGNYACSILIREN